jgi:uncharacterized protein
MRYESYWFWSVRKTALARLDLKEYLSREECIEMYFKERTQESLQSDCSMPKSKEIKVFLMTHWKYFGFSFNPVSYYFLYDKEEKIIGIISEVHNTPWNEKCWYTSVIPTKYQPSENFSDVGNEKKEWYVDRKLKKMHVSPFMEMNYEYHLHFTYPREEFNIYWQMKRISSEKASFFASLRMQSVPVSQNQLIRVLLEYPFMTFQVVLGIYFQALILWFKTPFFDHPKHQS